MARRNPWLALLLVAGCHGDFCARNSDCAPDEECSLQGECILKVLGPDAPSSDGGVSETADAATLVPDATPDAPPDAPVDGG